MGRKEERERERRKGRKETKKKITHEKKNLSYTVRTSSIN